jgi:hypothetical protein
VISGRTIRPLCSGPVVSCMTITSGAPPLASIVCIVSLSEQPPSSAARASTCWQTAADWPVIDGSTVMPSAAKKPFSWVMMVGTRFQPRVVAA